MAKMKKKPAPLKKPAAKPKSPAKVVTQKVPAKPKPRPAPEAERRHEGHDCPRGACCLWRLGLFGAGEIQFKLDRPYPCPIGNTASGSGFLAGKLRGSGPPCDEPHGLIPEDSRINAAIHPIRRDDDLAYLCGTFTITDPNQKPIFEGNIDLMHRINTHHPPFGPDPCDRRDHLQGWLSGRGAENSRARGYLLRAMLVARTDPLDGGVRGYALGALNINGVIIKCKE
jgi:hypothetical protein